MPTESLELVIISVMALVTYATRIGGVVGMSLFAMTPRVKAFLKWLGSSVVVALLASALVDGTPRMGLVIAVAATAMFLTRQALVAMLMGVCASIAVVGFG